MGNPINEKNSIESSGFVLVFERPFNKQELQSLSRLEQVFKDDLPAFKEINSIKVKVVNGSTSEQTLDISGVLLQSFKTNGKPAWELKVEHNIIEVSCFAYEDWTEVWKKAKTYLLETIKPLEDDTNKLVICVLKVVDKFLSNPDSYNVIDVFSQDTPYLTPNIIIENSKKFWHVFQGWFEELDSKIYLNNLNVINSDESGKVATHIDHAIQCQFIKNPLSVSVFKESELENVFSILHNKNKDILRKLLNETQLKRIGL